jgi:hypothetical protein
VELESNFIDFPSVSSILPSAGARHQFDVMLQQEVKVNRRRKINSARDVGDCSGGGIDILPDEVLQHVVSFLPAREAVQTCMLARRWRHLWRSMPALRITSGPRWEYITEQEFKDLNIFVCNLFLHRDVFCEFLVNPFEKR